MPLFVYCKTRPTGKKLDDNGRPIAFGVGDLAYNIYTFKNNANTSGDATSYQYFCHPLYNTGSAGGGNQTIDITSTTESNRQATVFNNITTSYQHQITKSNATLTFTKETNVQVSGSPDTNVSFDPKAGSGSVTVLTKKLGTSGTNGHTVTYTTAQLSIAQENVVTTAGTKGSGNTLSVQTGTDEAKFVTYIKPSSNKNGHEISYVIDTIRVSKETNVTVSGTVGNSVVLDPTKNDGGGGTGNFVIGVKHGGADTNGHSISYQTGTVTIKPESSISVSGSGSGATLNPVNGSGSATIITGITPGGTHGHALTLTTGSVTITQETSVTTTGAKDGTIALDPKTGNTTAVDVLVKKIVPGGTNGHKISYSYSPLTLAKESEITTNVQAAAEDTFTASGITMVSAIEPTETNGHKLKISQKKLKLPSNAFLNSHVNSHKFSVSNPSNNTYKVTLSDVDESRQPHDFSIITSNAIKGSFDATNRTVTISHVDTSSQSNVTAANKTYIAGVTLDDYGHVTGLTTKTITFPTVNDGSLFVYTGDTNRYTFTANQPGNTLVKLIGGNYISLTYDNGIKINHAGVGTDIQIASCGSTDSITLADNPIVVRNVRINALGHVDDVTAYKISHGGAGTTASTIKGTDNGSISLGETLKLPTVSIDSNGHVTGGDTTNIQLNTSYFNVNVGPTNIIKYDTRAEKTLIFNGVGATSVTAANNVINITSTDRSVTAVDYHYQPVENDSFFLAAPKTAELKFTHGVHQRVLVGLTRDAKGHIIGAKGVELTSNDTTYIKISNSGTLLGRIWDDNNDADTELNFGNNLTATIDSNNRATINAVDTKYSAGTGLSLSGTTFNHANYTSCTYTSVIRTLKVDSTGHVTEAQKVTGGQGRTIKDIVICTESTLPSSSSRDNDILYLVI